MLSHVFDELGLPRIAQHIFSELLERGPSTARQLAERLTIPRPSVYDNLKVLIAHGLVTERSQESRKIFLVDDVNNIPELLQTKIDTLKSEKDKFERLLPSLLKRTDFVEPKIKFYSGAEGVKQIMNRIIWHHNIEICIMWPIKEMMNVLGTAYLTEINKKRIKNHISLRAIYPRDQKVDLKEFPFLGVGGGHLRQVRLAPKGMNWNMGYSIYGDKVAFFSSQKESFGFVIHSKDFSELTQLQFEAIWHTSSPVRPEPQHTDGFLDTIREV